MALIDSILLFNKAYDVARPYGNGCERGLTLGDLAKLLDSMPEVEPERKKGKWIMYDRNAYRCSCCGKSFLTNQDYIKEHKFCFGCGADMRGEQNESD